MNQAPFVQIPCVKCGAAVFISPAAGMGYCGACQTPNQLPPGGAAAPMGGPPMGGGYGPPQGAPMGGPPMGGGYGPPQGAPMGAPGGYGPPPGGAPMGGPPMGAPGGYPPPGGAPMGGPPMGGQGGYPPPGGAPMGGPPMGAPGGYPPPGGGPPMGAPGYGAPGMPGMSTHSGGGGFGGSSLGSGGMLKAIGGGVGTVILVIVLAVVKFGFKSAQKSANTESLSSLGISEKKADPDKMIAAARAYALKWKSDAGFWSVNIQKLKSDGTVDLTTSNVVVEYFSPSAVSSPLQSMRDDSIKKFNFQNEDMVFRDIWGVRKQYNPAPAPTRIPGCTAKALAAKLVQMGLLKSGGTVHAQIDPQFGDEWLVQTGSVPKKFDLATCGEKK